MSNRPVPSSHTQHHWRSISRSEIDTFVHALSYAYSVIGVRENRGRYSYGTIEQPGELVLDIPPRTHSVKKFLFPNWEQLFRFKVGEASLFEPEMKSVPRVIIGIHPCDLHAIKVLDDCLFDGEVDSAYLAKRRSTLLIGVDCTPDSACFCGDVGSDRIADGFDLFLHRAGDDFLIETGSSEGELLLYTYATRVMERDEVAPIPLQPKGESTLPVSPQRLGELMHDAYDSTIWQELGEECLGCGACNLVCPTCYCFNVQDKIDLDLTSGERLRTWDSCQLDRFTKTVADDAPRNNQADRQRHRFFRKYNYLQEKYHRSACVGCGRCFRECLAKIDPRSVLNRLIETEVKEPALVNPGDEYRPEMARISAVTTLSDRDVMLQLDLKEPISFKAGMFLTLSVFGLGEAPFTIASSPHDGRQVDIVVRQVGNLTAAIHRLKPGDLVGVRGPFGSGIDIDSLVGRDLLLVASGLGLITFRSLLLTLMSRRDDFGRIVLLAGGKRPDTLPFCSDLIALSEAGLIDTRITVDESNDNWFGEVGGVHRLLTNLDIQPSQTTAFVSGSTRLYRATLSLVRGLGLSDEQLYVNLERRMKCGLGKCGSCQVNSLYVCDCGPIFRYDKVKHLREAF